MSEPTRPELTAMSVRDLCIQYRKQCNASEYAWRNLTDTSLYSGLADAIIAELERRCRPPAATAPGDGVKLQRYDEDGGSLVKDPTGYWCKYADVARILAARVPSPEVVAAAKQVVSEGDKWWFWENNDGVELAKSVARFVLAAR